MQVWNFISVKMTDMKSIPVLVSFRLNSCEHKESTEHRSEICNWDEISYRFEFISPPMGTYSRRNLGIKFNFTDLNILIVALF